MAASSAFVSYRRDDTRWAAIFVADALRRRLGAERVFLDVTTMRGGEDFRSTILRAAGGCRVLLAMVGPRWGSERLREPGDLVAAEIASALRHGRTVVPVLVDGAVVPAAVSLPDALRGLGARHAVRLTEHSFRSDVEGLCDLVASLLRAPAPRKPAAGRVTVHDYPVGTRPEDVARIRQLREQSSESPVRAKRPPPPLPGVDDGNDLAALVRARPLLLVAFRSPERDGDPWWVLPEVVSAATLRGEVVLVDVDRLPGVARDHEVTTTPTVVVFRDGRATARVTGPWSASTLRRDLAEFVT